MRPTRSSPPSPASLYKQSIAGDVVAVLRAATDLQHLQLDRAVRALGELPGPVSATAQLPKSLPVAACIPGLPTTHLTLPLCCCSLAGAAGV